MRPSPAPAGLTIRKAARNCCSFYEQNDHFGRLLRLGGSRAYLCRFRIPPVEARKGRSERLETGEADPEIRLERSKVQPLDNSK